MSSVFPHGGDWAGFREESGGGSPLDFSANISPLGVPQSVQRAVCAAAPEADRYPDPECRELRRAIAEQEGVAPEQVLCGNGAADLIWRTAFALRPKRALLQTPAFSEYEAALRAVDVPIEYDALSAKNDFAPTEGLLKKIPADGLVFLAQPNNPTGRLFPWDLLLRTAQLCRERNTVLVLDECFLPFTDETDCLAGAENVLVLKAFTKIYGMAGLRLGCLIGDETLLRRIGQAGPPWSVSSVAQAAGLAALFDTEYVKSVRRVIRAGRPYLFDGLSELGFHVVPGEANFLLFSSDRPLLDPLKARGILLRPCANFRGLSDRWYRTAVRTHSENEMLLQALQEVTAP